MYQTEYYVAYAAVSIALIVGLAATLHWAGDVFLEETLYRDPRLLRAISRLLDIGYYLVSIGYFTSTVLTKWPMSQPSEVAYIVSFKAGLLLLLLGVMHLFNLLILALFRKRPADERTAEAS